MKFKITVAWSRRSRSWRDYQQLRKQDGLFTFHWKATLISRGKPHWLYVLRIGRVEFNFQKEK